MYVRIVTYTGATSIDAGVRYLNDTAAPLLREQRGFRGVAASADRSGGVLGIMSLWDTEADRDASEGTLVKARAEGQRVIGGGFTVEHFEELLAVTARPPAVGCALLMRRVSMDPAKIEENLRFFRRDVLPRIAASPGFCAVRNMLSRQTGEGVVGTVWADMAAADAAAAASDARRPEAAQSGVIFGEQSKREIVFIDL